MKTKNALMCGVQLLLSALLIMFAFSASASQCPEGKSEVMITLPNGTQKPLCIDNSAAHGLEAAADHSTKTIFSMSCNSSASCSNTEYCAKPVGVCGNGTGYCNSLPGADEMCPQIYEPVCGCDGNTYSNACEATKFGINVTHAGACQ